MWLFYISIALLCFAIYFVNYVKKKREIFVSEHSPAIRALNEINEKYAFKTILNFDMVQDYDNAHFYESISPKDYLTYQLVYKASAIRLAIKDTKENNKLYQLYKNEITQSCVLGQLEEADGKDEDIWIKIERLLKVKYILKKEYLLDVEKAVFNSLIKNPTTSFKLKVTLRQTQINGRFITSKSSFFETEAIETILTKLSHKQDGFYLDDDIWQSICRVERGKVSNKMRFSIYERDGNRCRKCGHRGNDLEVDHIFPISKGGKSTYDNLQTLCRRCNMQKSNTVERGAIDPRTRNRNSSVVCQSCGAPMRLVKGKYGDFWGCVNFPKCRFTKQK